MSKTDLLANVDALAGDAERLRVAIEARMTEYCAMKKLIAEIRRVARLGLDSDYHNFADRIVKLIDAAAPDFREVEEP